MIIDDQPPHTPAPDRAERIRALYRAANGLPAEDAVVPRGRHTIPPAGEDQAPPLPGRRTARSERIRSTWNGPFDPYVEYESRANEAAARDERLLTATTEPGDRLPIGEFLLRRREQRHWNR